MRLILRQKEARGTRGKADFLAKKREITVSRIAILRGVKQKRRIRRETYRRHMCESPEPVVSGQTRTISSNNPQS